MKALRMLLVAVLGALFLAVATTAATSVAAPAASPLYPPATCATMTISTTTPFAGEVVTVAGAKFADNSPYEIFIASTPVLLAHVTTNASGSFSAKVTIPANATGNHEIFALGKGVVSATCPTPIQITIKTQGTPSGGGLAFTGVDILGAIALALLLIGAGVFFTRSGRRASAHGGSRHN